MSKNKFIEMIIEKKQLKETNNSDVDADMLKRNHSHISHEFDRFAILTSTVLDTMIRTLAKSIERIEQLDEKEAIQLAVKIVETQFIKKDKFNTDVVKRSRFLP